MTVDNTFVKQAIKLPVVEDVNGNETNLNRLRLDNWTDGVKQRRHSVPHSLPISSRSRESSAPKKHILKELGAAGDVVFMDKLIPEDSPIRSM